MCIAIQKHYNYCFTISLQTLKMDLLLEIWNKASELLNKKGASWSLYAADNSNTFSFFSGPNISLCILNLFTKLYLF